MLHELNISYSANITIFHCKKLCLVKHCFFLFLLKFNPFKDVLFSDIKLSWLNEVHVIAYFSTKHQKLNCFKHATKISYREVFSLGVTHQIYFARDLILLASREIQFLYKSKMKSCNQEI